MLSSEGALHDDESPPNAIQALLINVGLLGFFIAVGFLVLLAMAIMGIGPLRHILPW